MRSLYSWTGLSFVLGHGNCILSRATFAPLPQTTLAPLGGAVLLFPTEAFPADPQLCADY